MLSLTGCRDGLAIQPILKSSFVHLSGSAPECLLLDLGFEEETDYRDQIDIIGNGGSSAPDTGAVIEPNLVMYLEVEPWHQSSLLGQIGGDHRRFNTFQKLLFSLRLEAGRLLRG